MFYIYALVYNPEFCSPLPYKLPLNVYPAPGILYHYDFYNINYFHEIEAFLTAQLVKNLPAIQETWVQFLGWEDLLEKKKATHSCILV